MTLWKSPELEQAFKELKGDLGLRPIHHQTDQRIEAHIFVAFLAYCVNVTLKQRLKARAPGLTPRAVIDKFKDIQMLDLEITTTDGRILNFSRFTQPNKDHKILLKEMSLVLPSQSPPTINKER